MRVYRYDIMSHCWCESPADRPSFEQLRHQLETLLVRDVNYLDLDNIDEPLIARSQSETANAAAAGDDDDDEEADRGRCHVGMSTALLPLHLDVC